MSEPIELPDEERQFWNRVTEYLLMEYELGVPCDCASCDGINPLDPEILAEAVAAVRRGWPSPTPKRRQQKVHRVPPHAHDHPGGH